MPRRNVREVSSLTYRKRSDAAITRKRYGYRLVRESDAAVETSESRLPVRCPRDVFALMEPLARQEPSEVFWVLCLDSQHKVPTDGVIAVTRGILNSSLVHPREVFREAILRNAAALVLCHNHPSGDPTPSADDRVITDQLAAAGRLLDIPIHDHVIIGHGRYTSFAESGLI